MTETIIPRRRRARLSKLWRYDDSRRLIGLMRLMAPADIVRGEKSSGRPGVCASATRSACRVQLAGGAHAESNLAVLTNFTGAVLTLALRTYARYGNRPGAPGGVDDG